ncbi:hydantoinase/oxoprolinase family protein [Kitasatospora phosalacinea]|uniref:hydantoinase/oxoprolinase family protein n=1 Tax=Kitasatospora phosalacinea TaxID=2065 RepID=UPI00364DA602
MRLGIDLGRVTTCAVLVDGGGAVVRGARVGSLPSAGASVGRVLASLGPLPELTAAALATRHDRGPVVPARVAVLRIARPSHPALAPLADWPAGARALVEGQVGLAVGGSTLTGQPLGELDRAAVRAFAERAAAAGLSAFAVCAAGAPARPEPEWAAAETISQLVPGARITLSHEFGAAGLRERENTAVVDAALGGWAGELVGQVTAALRAAGSAAPLFVARDDGGLVSAEYFGRHPVVGAAGSTGSALVGAALRAGARRVVAVDVARDEMRCAVVVDGELVRAEAAAGPFGVRTVSGGPDVLRSPVVDPLRRPAVARALVERVRELAPDSEVGWSGGACADAGAPAGDAGAGPDDAALAAARAGCRIEFDQVVVAVGREELEESLESAREQALSRVLSAGAVPGTARVDRLVRTPLAYLPPGAYRLRVRALGTPGARG